MKSRVKNQRRLCLERLEDRTVPSGCQAWGEGVIAVLVQTVKPAGYLIAAPIAQSAPGALADVISAEHAVLCS